MSEKVQERIAGKMIFSLSQKGGCGKSFVVRSFVQWGRHQGWPIAAYDGDSGVGTTYRALGTRERGRLLDVQDPLVGAGRYSLRHDLQRQEVVNTMAARAPSIFHDLPGGSANDLLKVQDEGLSNFSNLMFIIEMSGYSLTLLHVVTDEISTVHSVRQYLDAFGSSARHIAVLNRAFQDKGGGFVSWEGSKTRKMLQDLGGKEIFLPALKPEVRDKLDALHLPITAGFLEGGLTIDESGHLLRFTRELAEQLKLIEDWIY